MGRYRSTWHVENRASRKGSASESARHGAYRETPSVFREVHGWLRSPGISEGARPIALFRWRLESGSFGPRALARIVPLRQRVSDTGTECLRVGLQDEQDVADGISGLWRATGDD